MAEALTSTFYLSTDLTESVEHPIAHGTAVIFTARNPEREGPNEDAAAIIPAGHGRGVLVLADGAGGYSHGEEASRLAVEAIEASVRNRDNTEEEMRTAILNGVELANENIRALGVGAASTLAVVEIADEWIRTYHVGDSGIIATGQRGLIKTRTVDHSPTGYAIEAGFMNDREAIRHEERHLVTNIVGMADMRIDIGASLQLARRDTVLMASDGLFDNLQFDHIVDRVRKGRLINAVNELAAGAHRRMRSTAESQPSKPDDLTIIAYRPHPEM